jgi:aryl-alcohol dehydrogenase-like predicted oxidoreductase
MKYVPVGYTGVRVSKLCLGTMTLSDLPVAPTGGLPGADRDTSFAILDAFEKAGGNFIDTANIYQGGSSERVLGDWLAAEPTRRRRMVISTKIFFPNGAGPNDRGASRMNLILELDECLKRLKTTYVDFLLIHSWDYLTSIEEQVRTMNDLVKSGKILYWGISNWSASTIVEACLICKQFGYAPPVMAQLQHSLVERSIELEILPVCRRFGLLVQQWSPLSGGVLTGRYSREKSSEEGSRTAWADKVGFALGRNSEYVWNTVDMLKSFAGQNTVAMAIAWCAAHLGCVPIIGARSIAQLNDNLAAADLVLDQEQLEKLNAVSVQPRPYPFSMHDMGNRNREVP